MWLEEEEKEKMPAEQVRRRIGRRGRIHSRKAEDKRECRKLGNVRRTGRLEMLGLGE